MTSPKSNEDFLLRHPELRPDRNAENNERTRELNYFGGAGRPNPFIGTSVAEEQVVEPLTMEALDRAMYLIEQEGGRPDYIIMPPDRWNDFRRWIAQNPAVGMQIEPAYAGRVQETPGPDRVILSYAGLPVIVDENAPEGTISLMPRIHDHPLMDEYEPRVISENIELIGIARGDGRNSLQVHGDPNDLVVRIGNEYQYISHEEWEEMVRANEGDDEDGNDTQMRQVRHFD